MNQRKAGVVLSYISQGIAILSALIYTPVMLKLLGQGEYGLYQLVNSTVSYLGLLNLGFAGAYLRFYTRLETGGREKEIAKLNGMFMTVFLVMAAICLLCGSIMIYNIRAVFGTGLRAAELQKAKILMGFMLFDLALGFPNSVMNCCITAQEQFVFQRAVLIAQNLLNPFLALPLLLMGCGSVGMVFVSTALTIAAFGVNLYFCLYKMHTRFLFGKFDRPLLKEIWVFTFFIFLNQIIDQVNWSTDKYLLGRIAGTEAVAIYSLGSQINNMYLMFSTSVSGVFTPKVNQMVAGGSGSRPLTELFTKVGRIQFMVLVLVLSEFIIFGKQFIYYWAGMGYQDSYYVALLLICPATVSLIQNLGIEIQRAKNMHQARSVVYFLIAIGNVFISIPLAGRYGPAGAAAGTAVSLVLGNILFMNWYYHKKLGLDMIYFWKSIAGILPAFLVPFFAGFCIYRWIRPVRFAGAVGLGIVYFLVYIVFLYQYGFNGDEKAMVRTVFMKLCEKMKQGKPGKW